MTPEHGESAAGDESAGGVESADGDRTVSVLGTEVVVEESFAAFPWRAGMARAPGAFVAAFVLVTLLAAVGGFGSGSLQRRFSLLGIVVFNAHNVPAAVGVTPQLLAPVAEPVIGLPGLGRLLRGLFTFGVGHANPPAHVADVLAGQTDEIGHVNVLQLQAAAQGRTDVPLVLYYLVPPLALLGAGYEFADSHPERATDDPVVGPARYGLAIAAGYVVVMLVGSVLFSAQMTSTLGGVVTVLPDRFLTVALGFAYPAVFASVGAAIALGRRGNP